MTNDQEQVQAIIGETLMKKTILFLASDAAIRKVISKTLESVGYLVLSADELGNVVDLLKDFTPDLFMVRHFTEDVPGHEAAMYVRSILPGIPVLLVGGIPDDPDLEDRETVQGFEIFPKPFPASELLDKVEEMLRKSRFRADSGAIGRKN